MPQGKGTYGSQRGRPRKKLNIKKAIKKPGALRASLGIKK